MKKDYKVITYNLPNITVTWLKSEAAARGLSASALLTEILTIVKNNMENAENGVE